MAFEPGITPVPVSGKIITKTDKAMMHKAVDEGWLTEGHFVAEFERKLEQYVGVREAIMVNSGSSANLLALTALELPKGSEVITVACAFPTTVNPIIQNGLVPVFVDVDDTFNIDPKQLEKALSPKTQAVMVAHTLGNPFHAGEVIEFCIENELDLIEDCCDAMGATFEGVKVGFFGDIATLSFYPAHQITTGEGGALLTNKSRLSKTIRSYRDWGRDCWCTPGKDDTCGKRFCGEYDHKYTYSRIGYNLKSTDLQAACGLTQMDRIDEFVQARRKNWAYLYYGLKDRYMTQQFYKESNPSPFGYAIATKDPIDMAKYLTEHKIGCRPVFAGNLLRQPAYKDIECRVIGDIPMTNWIHDHVLWVGCWPGLNKEMLDYTIKVLLEY